MRRLEPRKVMYEQLPDGHRGYRSDACFRSQHKRCKNPNCTCKCHKQEA